MKKEMTEKLMKLRRGIDQAKYEATLGEETPQANHYWANLLAKEIGELMESMRTPEALDDKATRNAVLAIAEKMLGA